MIKGLTILLMAGLAMSPLPAFAGFDFDTTNHAINISNDISQPWAPLPEAKSSGAVRPESDPYAPSLQTFEERYVPDTVKNKYKISNDWYGKGEVQPVTQEELPDSSTADGPTQLQSVNPAASSSDLPAPALTQNKNSEMRWVGLTGTSLQEVLQGWAKKEDAALIWQVKENFALKKPVNQDGPFEDAIFRALSQYDNDRARPVGQLYIDPATGHKTLVVRTDTAS